jgi:hypothetical protein
LGEINKAVDDYNNYLKIEGNKGVYAGHARQKIRELGYAPIN